jgi:hypothetical protein
MSNSNDERMSNDEIRMTNCAFRYLDFVIPSPFAFRHSSFQEAWPAGRSTDPVAHGRIGLSADETVTKVNAGQLTDRGVTPQRFAARFSAAKPVLGDPQATTG